MIARISKRRSLSLTIVTLLLCSCVGCGIVIDPGWSPRKQRALVAEPEIRRLLQIANRQLRYSDISHLTAARAALRLAGEISPNDARVIDGFGCVSWRLGRYDEAESFFKSAFRNDPSYARALGHLALSFHRRGDQLQAFQLYRAALAIHPTDARTRNNLAVLKALMREGGQPNKSEVVEELFQASLTATGDEGATIGANLAILGK